MVVFHTALVEQLGTSRGGVLILPVITVSCFGSVRSDLTTLIPFKLHPTPQNKYFDVRVRSSVRKAHPDISADIAELAADINSFIHEDEGINTPTLTMVYGFDHLSWLA